MKNEMKFMVSMLAQRRIEYEVTHDTEYGTGRKFTEVIVRDSRGQGSIFKFNEYGVLKDFVAYAGA